MGRILGVRPTSSPVVAQRTADRSSVPQSQARRSEGILALAPVVLLPAPPSTGLTPWLSGWLVKCRLPGRGGGREWEGMAKEDMGSAAATARADGQKAEGDEEGRGGKEVGSGSGWVARVMLYMILDSMSMSVQYHPGRIQPQPQPQRNATQVPRMSELQRLTRGRVPAHPIRPGTGNASGRDTNNKTAVQIPQ